MTLVIGSACSGIGGLERGLELAGLGAVRWQVELDPFCRRVLAKHWPESRRHDDLCTADVAGLDRVDLLCGGVPCQPVSVAGKRLAQKDARWLWPHFARLIAAVDPSWVVVENVLGLRTAGLRDVLADLAALGFDAEWTVLSAADVGAPHLRKRLFVVASDPERVDIRQQPGWLSRSLERQRSPVSRDALAALVAADSDSVRRLQSARRFAELRGWPRYPGGDFGQPARVDDGIRTGLHGSAGRVANAGKRRKALGNAVVVPCSMAIGRAILQTMEAA